MNLGFEPERHFLEALPVADLGESVRNIAQFRRYFARCHITGDVRQCGT